MSVLQRYCSASLGKIILYRKSCWQTDVRLIICKCLVLYRIARRFTERSVGVKSKITQRRRHANVPQSLQSGEVLRKLVLQTIRAHCRSECWPKGRGHFNLLIKIRHRKRTSKRNSLYSASNDYYLSRDKRHNNIRRNNLRIRPVFIII